VISGRGRGCRFAVGGGEERELLEELEDVRKIGGVFGEFFEVGVAGVGVVVGGAEVVVIDAFEDGEDHGGRRGELAVGGEFVEGVAELFPVFGGFSGDLELEEAAPSPESTLHPIASLDTITA
jgi:hypothetical protein